MSFQIREVEESRARWDMIVSAADMQRVERRQARRAQMEQDTRFRVSDGQGGDHRDSKVDTYA